MQLIWEPQDSQKSQPALGSLMGPKRTLCARNNNGATVSKRDTLYCALHNSPDPPTRDPRYHGRLRADNRLPGIDIQTDLDQLRISSARRSLPIAMRRPNLSQS
jgi:hypothetical protein